MHELLMNVTGMRLKIDFLAEVFVSSSMRNELVLSPLQSIVLTISPPFTTIVICLKKPGIEPTNPGLQGKWFIHHTTAAPFSRVNQNKAMRIL